MLLSSSGGRNSSKKSGKGSECFKIHSNHIITSIIVSSILPFLVPLLASILATGLAFPKVLRLAVSKNLVDNPDARKLQRIPVPVLGGVPVFLGILTGICCAHLFFDCSRLMPLISAMTIILMVGIADDIVGLTPRIRFLIEILLVLFICLTTGHQIDHFHHLWNIDLVPAALALPLSLIAGVGIINAINLIDGVDGLSSGFSIQAFICFAAINLLIGNQLLALLALLGIGALLPFFFHNVFGRTSKMFIGDGGTLVIGAIFATLVICLLSDDQLTFRLPERLGLIPFTLAVMCIPVFDTLRVMTSRIVRHKSPFSADKTHLHHLFIDLGFSHIGTTLCILALNLSVILIWWLSYSLGASIDVQFYIVLLLSISVTFLFYGFMRRQIKRQTALYRAARRLAGAIHLRQRPLFIFLQRLADGKR